MLDIINGKLATITSEGAFETTPVEAHRQITDLLLGYMQDSNPEHTIENFKNALKLYDIGGQIYKSSGITEKETNDCLIPLLQEIVYDRSERHLAALVMRYVAREFYYKITERIEPDSLDTFYNFVRYNMLYISLTETMDQELYYRLVDAIFCVSDYAKSLQALRKEVREDYAFVHDDYIRYRNAVRDNTTPPKYQPHEYFYITQPLLVLPFMVTEWVDFEKYNGKWDSILKSMIKSTREVFFKLDKETKVFVMGDGKYPYELNYHFFQRSGSEISDSYEIARAAGDLSTQYLIAQLIGEDAMRRKIAKAAGCTHKIPGGGRSTYRRVVRALKFAAVGVAIYVAYTALKAIYDFIDMPTVFWLLVIGALGGLGGTGTLKTMAIYDHRAYRYVRMKQAEETIKAIKEKK